MSFEDNTVNGGEGRSIQRVKLVQKVKDKTQRTQRWTDLDLGVDTQRKTELTLKRRGNDIKHKCTE